MYNQTPSYSTSDSLFADNAVASGAGIALLMIGIVFVLIVMALSIVSIVSMWKLFTKAGKPGWASIVPIYKYIVELEIIGQPLWWIVMFFIPVANIVIAIMMTLDLVKSFGKDTTFGVLTIFFPIIMLPILAFSKDTKYVGPVGPERY